MNLMDYLTHAGSVEIYVAIFIIALLEGFLLTTFLINGTIAIVGIGWLIANGYLHPFVSLVCVYTGTLAGDTLSYIFSTRLQRLRIVAAHVPKYHQYRMPLADTPFRFIVLGHMTPYLKGVTAFLAGGLLPWRTWFIADAVGACCGTLFFAGLGVAGSRLVQPSSANSIHRYIAIAFLCLCLAVWLFSFRTYRLKSAAEQSSPCCPQSRNWKRAFFLFYYYPWHLVRWAEALLRQLPTRAQRNDLSAAFPDVRAGDIFLIRLHAVAPWGKWAHSAIALGNNRFCHGFSKTITAHSLQALPIRYAIAHVRVRCDMITAETAANIAAAKIGTPVSILARNDDTTRFSCASLIYHAYATAGIALHNHKITRVIPDDLINSPYVDIVRIVFTEQTRTQGVRQEITHAHQQRACN